jgi:cobalamin biosynthesis Co2+ chelatase CbiK
MPKNKNKLINKINNIIADETNMHEICELFTFDKLIDKLINKLKNKLNT